MSEMVERIAKACCEASPFFDNEWAEQDVHMKEMWRIIARAAIEAMQEPTKDMLSAGAYYHIRHAGPAGNIEIGLAEDAYKAMVKAAL